MRTKAYSDFWQRIHKIAREKGFPLRMMFELTYRCNFKCKHCYVPAGYRKMAEKELETKEVLAILDQLKDLGCFYLGFTGGEPFLRKDIFEILWYVKRLGFQIIIYTNGSLIGEYEASELERLNPNKVDITIPAMSEDAFERISGVKDSRGKVFKAVDLLYKNKVKLGFKTCVLKENEKEIKDIQNFASSLGAFHRLDNKLSPRLDGDMTPYRYRGRARDRFEDCDIDPRPPAPAPQHLFKCGVGVRQAAITPFGELKMCVMIDNPKYKILKRQRIDLKGAWRKLREFVADIKIDGNYKCNMCELRAYCKWCPAMAWLYNKTFNSCDLENRHLAERMEYETKPISSEY